MNPKSEQLIQAALEWHEAYEKYAKSPSGKYNFDLFASQIKLFIAIREYKGK